MFSIKKNLISAIFFISIISSIGVLISEISLKREYQFQKDKFNADVKTAMSNIVDRLGTYNPIDGNNQNPLKYMYNCNVVYHIGEIIPKKYFDFVVKEEIRKKKIKTDFEYGIITSANNTMVLGEYGRYKSELIKSQYSLRLSCMWENITIYLAVYFPQKEAYLNSQINYWYILSILFYIILIISLIIFIFYVVKEKKLSNLKANFINNMTHEFKTPISTISLTSELLLKPEIYQSPEKLTQYATIIHQENNKLNKNVEQILQIALLEKGRLKLNKTNIDVHKTIKTIIKNFSINLISKKGNITTDFAASNYFIIVDMQHFNNVITNLLDNAVKYSIQPPEITVSTKNDDNGLFISISDKGIGINNENQKHIFKQFYRVASGDIHDVKGFGLGLSYVKTIVEEHDGTIKVNSKLGEGSNFEIYLPF